MDKQQYDAMSMIMEKGRKFLDEIFHMMKDHGLTDQGFEMRLYVDETHDIKKSLKCDYLLSIDLGKDTRFVSDEEFYKSYMSQWNKDGKGWVVMNDPCGKRGTVPEDKDLSDLPFTDIGGEKDDGSEAGETATGSTASGDMWFSTADDDPPMDCRV